jgi:hypothetical protein
MTSRPRYTVTLTPIPPGPDRHERDAIMRLRLALKVLRRALGLLAVRVEEKGETPR